jgi:hypothetical protein
MANKLNEQLKNHLHPYLFALKEGKKIQQDFLDYSLMLIQVHNGEVMHSPRHYQTEDTISTQAE